MNSAAQVLDTSRSAASALVEREYRRTGSLGLAYENVGAMVGMSGSWIAKFVKRRPEVKEPGLTVGLNILAMAQRLCGYVAVCELVEEAAERELAEAGNLQRQIDAATAILNQVVERQTQAQTERTDFAPRQPKEGDE